MKEEKKERPSFLKKRSKRLLFSGHGLDLSGPWLKNKSLFGSFFSKKEHI